MMMEINGPAHVHGAQPLSSPHAKSNVRPSSPASSVQGSDEVQISQEADFVARVNELPDVRQDKVDAIRAQIADGTYDTDDKLDTAIDRILDELA